MMTQPSMLRRAYDGVALFAVLNVLGLAALIGYLVNSGAMDGEKIRRVVAVLRGEDEENGEEDVAGAETAEGEPTESPKVGVDAVAESQIDGEILRLESDRIKAELAQRLALNNSILLRVTTERESVRQEREDAARKQEAVAAKRNDEGFKKQIAIFESLSPKVAVEHLLSLSEPDAAARILLELTTRKARKIVEAAKRLDQIERMKVILRRVRDVAPERSTELGDDGP